MTVVLCIFLGDGGWSEVAGFVIFINVPIFYDKHSHLPGSILEKHEGKKLGNCGNMADECCHLANIMLQWHFKQRQMPSAVLPPRG